MITVLVSLGGEAIYCISNAVLYRIHKYYSKHFMENTFLSGHHGDKGLYSSVDDSNLFVILWTDEHTPFLITYDKLFIVL